MVIFFSILYVKYQKQNLQKMSEDNKESSCFALGLDGGGGEDRDTNCVKEMCSRDWPDAGINIFQPWTESATKQVCSIKLVY